MRRKQRLRACSGILPVPFRTSISNATHLSMKCVLDCVKGGSPLAILTKDGDLYLPISDKMPDADQRQKLMPFVGKYVRASGTVFERKWHARDRDRRNQRNQRRAFDDRGRVTPRERDVGSCSQLLT